MVGLFTQNISDIKHQKRVKTLGVELKPKLVVRRVPASKSPHLHHTGGILKQCRGFTQKTHYVFSVLTTPEKFEIATITVYFRLAFEEENWTVKSHDYHDTIVLEKLHFEMFSVHTSRFLGCHATLPQRKFCGGALRDIPENGCGRDQHQREKTAFSNSVGLKSIFEKLHFRDVFVLTAGLTVEIKLCFQIPPV